MNLKEVEKNPNFYIEVDAVTTQDQESDALYNKDGSLICFLRKQSSYKDDKVTFYETGALVNRYVAYGHSNKYFFNNNGEEIFVQKDCVFEKNKYGNVAHVISETTIDPTEEGLDITRHIFERREEKYEQAEHEFFTYKELNSKYRDEKAKETEAVKAEQIEKMWQEHEVAKKREFVMTFPTKDECERMMAEMPKY